MTDDNRLRRGSFIGFMWGLSIIGSRLLPDAATVGVILLGGVVAAVGIMVLIAGIFGDES